MRERNIQSAWQKGGDFEEKAVTDERLMKFFTDKLKTLSPDDPMANDVRNTIVQYDFAIENSKMELKYAQKKVGDGAMVAFYKNWAGKLPVNSEAYRERMKLAAGYADRAASGSAASNHEAEQRAYANHQNDIYNSTQFAHDYVMSSVLAAARSGIKGMILPVLDTQAETWEDVRVAEGDGNHLAEIMNLLATDPDLQQWRDDTTAFIKTHGDPHFNGDFSYEANISRGRAAIAGLNQQIKYGRKKGAPVSDYEKKRDKEKGAAIQLDTVDEKAIYEDARTEWQEIVHDPAATIAEKWAANQKYHNTLGNLFDRAKAAGNDLDAGAYNTEYMATAGILDEHAPATMYESSRREDTAKHPAETGKPEEGDAAGTSSSVQLMASQLQQLQARGPNGAPLFVQVRVDTKGNPTSSRDAIFAVLPAAMVPGAAFIVTDADAKGTIQIGGGKVPSGGVITAVVPTPVTVIGMREDPITHQRFGVVGEPTVVGNKITLDNGTDWYSFVDDSGATRYSRKNPFTSEATPTSNGDEIVVPIGDDKAQTKWEKKPPQYSQFVQPDFFNSTINTRMPNTVVNSIPAGEMIADPKNAYGKYTPASIHALATAQSGNDPNAYARIYGEVDTLRADWIKGGGLDWSTRVRMTRMNQNGDMPTLADMNELNSYVHSAEVPDWATSQEQAALESQLIKGSVMYLPGGEKLWMPGESDATKRARETADRIKKSQTTIPSIISQPQEFAAQTRNMANGLISGVWGHLYTNPEVPGYTSGYIPTPQGGTSIQPTGPTIPTSPGGMAPPPSGSKPQNDYPFTSGGNFIPPAPAPVFKPFVTPPATTGKDVKPLSSKNPTTTAKAPTASGGGTGGMAVRKYT